MWGFDLHAWEQIMLWSLGCAFIAALVLAVSMMAVVFRQKAELKTSKLEFEEYKLAVEGKVLAAEAKVLDARQEGIEAGKSAESARLKAVDLEKQQRRKENAEANARKLESQPVLEKFKGPRSLKQPQVIVEKLKPFGAIPFDIALNVEPEAIVLTDQITGALRQAGWIWKGASTAGGYGRLDLPAMGVVAMTGVLVEISESKSEEWDVPAQALLANLSAEGIDVRKEVVATSDTAIHIKIGKRPS